MEISEKAPAKLNFSLDTPFRHPDGNPEWKMVMIAVDLADYVHIKTKTDSKDITVRTDTGFLPCDERNLAFQAAKKLQQLSARMKASKSRLIKTFPFPPEWAADHPMRPPFCAV